MIFKGPSSAHSIPTFNKIIFLTFSANLKVSAHFQTHLNRKLALEIVMLFFVVKRVNYHEHQFALHYKRKEKRETCSVFCFLTTFKVTKTMSLASISTLIYFLLYYINNIQQQRTDKKSDLIAGSLQNRSIKFSTIFSNKEIITAIVSQLDLREVVCKHSSEN